MDWPEWFSDPKVAVAIALASAAFAFASAAFSGGQFIYTRKIANNDTKKMRRKLPITEVVVSSGSGVPGWDTCRIIVRNQEPVSALVKSITARRRGALLVHERDTIIGGDSPGTYSSERIPETDFPSGMQIPGKAQVAPVGTKFNQQSYLPYETAHIHLLSKGVSGPMDVSLTWEWADGHAT